MPCIPAGLECPGLPLGVPGMCNTAVVGGGSPTWARLWLSWDTSFPGQAAGPSSAWGSHKLSGKGCRDRCQRGWALRPAPTQTAGSG